MGNNQKSKIIIKYRDLDRLETTTREYGMIGLTSVFGGTSIC
jgi:hypothetical protein